MSNGIVSYQPTSLGELEALCARICKTGMVPQAYRGKPDEAVAAMIFGNEIGLPPLTALQFTAVINGRPGIYGDALPGLAMNKGLIRGMQELFEGKPYDDDFTAVCIVTRPNGEMVTQRFSVADAKRAGLWDKPGPWKQYPQRMLQWRARGWAIRDAAPNLLFGMTAEELQDIEIAGQQYRGPEAAKDITPTAAPTSPREAVQRAIDTAEDATAVDPSDPLNLSGLSAREAIGTLQWQLEGADAAEADRLWRIYEPRFAKLPDEKRKLLEQIVLNKISPPKVDEWGTEAQQPELA